ncbi:MAG: hypothetical protein Q4D13_05235 [Erysipelotrichaceae bacterium]|nr:hypothetical protein [Erysipelotrichaceae bacterium]
MITGTVGESHYEILDCQVVDDPNIKDIFDEGYAIYEEKLLVAAQQAEEDFRNGELETPSYDNLLRYSGSYTETKIKMNVRITEVEADGLFMPGTIWGSYEGQEIILVDERGNKEPKILTGDYITLYGYGDGTSVIKTYKKGTGVLGSDLGAEVVSEVTVPKIKIIYCDFN